MSDVDYAMEMFDVMEVVVATSKALGDGYEGAYSKAVDIAITRSSMGLMDEATTLYDSSNILATFNILWGE